ncbi:DUF3885 domain-containing protein [Bacillus sp. JJ1127]|uniref:DUF3885 domain-containing protein n=1 Tax=Bacillus sp. JJ1127 TaxID=3122952 RepID=UPI002FFFE18F
MELKEYMNGSFPGVILKPSIYFQWENHLHFDFGIGKYQLQNNSDELNMNYFSQVYQYNKELFHDIFSIKDTMFLVTNVYRMNKDKSKVQKKIKVYNRYIKKKELKFHVKQETLPYMFEEEEEAGGYCTYQFSLQCQKEDIRYASLLKAVNNESIPSLHPRLGSKQEISYPDVFFVNATKDIIMFIYDDRGCEVIAKNKEIIRYLYKKYKNWIPCYERESIDDLFK